ncbi:MAG TPA: ferrous iron transport protein B [Bacteroidia bacterium]|jgi:ferrous iron transport protein B|nr:ferrous iron transport protein B [Bacteroidia bacterium]
MEPGTSEIRSKTISVALLGNPNSGKTTLFNSLTGLNQKTGNYPGVTVDKHVGTTKTTNGIKLSITDLPGTYSLYPKSLDEEVACKVLLGNDIDVAVVVTDSSNLKRHLLLATQVIDLKIPAIVVLNMIDEADALGLKIDKEELSRLLGVKIVAVNSRSGEGFEELKSIITEATISENTFYDVSKPNELNTEGFKNIIEKQFERNTEYNKKLNAFEEKDTVYRFNVINYIFVKTVTLPLTATRSFSEKADKIITHPIFGYGILLLVLFVVFQFIFFIAEFPMEWIENAFAFFMEKVSGILPAGQLSDLLVNGVLAGLSGIVVFIPQIALLFLFIGLLEDSGYMARVSFIMDKIFRRFGLNGKSVIPIVSGVACAVPSILGARTISNYKERLITILVIPLMSCSARLPVYTLLISLMVPDEIVFGIFNLKGLILLGMYLLGFVATLATAFVLKLIVKTKEKSYFIMELPVYRMPQWKSIGVIVVGKVKVFLWEAGKIILAISIILWFLSSHCPDSEFKRIDLEYKEAMNTLPNDSMKNVFEKQMQSAKLEASYAGWLGKKIEPAIKPLGFDWKIGIALITSFAAREVFVGTMATIYSANDSENVTSVREKLILEKEPDGKPKYSAAVCLSLLVFYAFAMQCMSTMAVVLRETKSWKWTLIQFFYMTGLAYLSSYLVYNLF